jgi:hypothetical protein
VAVLTAAWFLEEGTAFDIVVGLGHALAGAALLFFFQGWLRETSKPED